VTGFVAAVVEAWQELRIHKLRVLLSLIGVGVAVCSLTTAVAVSAVAEQALVEGYERESGRPAFFTMYAYSEESGGPIDVDDTSAVVAETMEHFGIDFHSIRAEGQGSAVLAGERQPIIVRTVEAPYGQMHRVVPTGGRWLGAADAESYGPSIVVDATFAKALGLAPSALPATVTLGADTDVTATIVGTVASENYDMPVAFVLPQTYDRWFSGSAPLMDPSYEMWVPEAGSEELGEAVRAYLQARLPGASLDVSRQDYLAWGDEDPLGSFRLAVSGVSVLILLLGALSLLNIALVTIRQRVREIGIRRSFGATSGRVFFSVVMESVVATFVAGAVGVAAAVAIVNSEVVRRQLLDGVSDVPPFPLSSALLGLGVSLLVGALAGVLPAIVAVRVRIIDAIRF
jgi:ABC-type lipoprotein release transport system permease subunit